MSVCCRRWGEAAGGGAKLLLSRDQSRVGSAAASPHLVFHPGARYPALVRYPLVPVRHPPELVGHHRTLVGHSWELVRHPWGLVCHPRALVCHPWALVCHPWGLVRHPQGLVGHPWELVGHPWELVARYQEQVARYLLLGMSRQTQAPRVQYPVNTPVTPKAPPHWEWRHPAAIGNPAGRRILPGKREVACGARADGGNMPPPRALMNP